MKELVYWSVLILILISIVMSIVSCQHVRYDCSYKEFLENPYCV